MTVLQRPNGLVKLVADEGLAIRRIGNKEKSTITEAYLAPGDVPDSWEDCEYETWEHGEEEVLAASVKGGAS